MSPWWARYLDGSAHQKMRDKDCDKEMAPENLDEVNPLASSSPALIASHS